MRSLFFVEAQRGQIADEDGIGSVVGDLLEESFLGGFDDAEGGEGDGLIGIARELHGFFVAADVFEVGIDEGGARSQSKN